MPSDINKRRLGSSPTLRITITPGQYEQAKQSHSGACLVADAIKELYPELSNISVDVTTIRASDRQRGERYVYLTPPTAQQVLLAYDQGWPNPVNKLVVRGAIKVYPITASGKSAAERLVARNKRIAELKAKKSAGTLTKNERQALTRMMNAPPPVDRPPSRGRARVVKTPDRNVVIVGGDPPVQGPAHPNLLRSRNRHFGAKLADPGEVFRQALDAAVEERLREERKAAGGPAS